MVKIQTGLVYFAMLSDVYSFPFALFPAAWGVALCVVLFDVEAGVSDCLDCRNQPSKRRHSVTQTQASKRSKLIQSAFLVENPPKMDQIISAVEPLRQFSKDSLRLVKRCTKPDRKGEKYDYKSKVVGFINNLYNMNGRFDQSMVFFQSSRRSRQRRQSVSPSWDSSGSSWSSSTFPSTTSSSDERWIVRMFYKFAPRMDGAVVSLLRKIIT